MNHPFPQQTAWETKSRSMQGCIFSYADVGKNVIMSQNQLNLDREKAEAREATARAADETEEIEAPSKSSLSNISSPQSVERKKVFPKIFVGNLRFQFKYIPTARGPHPHGDPVLCHGNLLPVGGPRAAGQGLELEAGELGVVDPAHGATIMEIGEKQCSFAIIFAMPFLGGEGNSLVVALELDHQGLPPVLPRPHLSPARTGL